MGKSFEFFFSKYKWLSAVVFVVSMCCVTIVFQGKSLFSIVGSNDTASGHDPDQPQFFRQVPAKLVRTPLWNDSIGADEVKLIRSQMLAESRRGETPSSILHLMLMERAVAAYFDANQESSGRFEGWLDAILDERIGEPLFGVSLGNGHHVDFQLFYSKKKFISFVYEIFS